MITVALVGRPNVGKSTLFNRLTGTRHALVDPTPGVTRDRREGDAHIGPLQFRVIDTAGLEEAAPDTLPARMMAQTMAGIKQADVALLLLDGRAGLLPQDKTFAEILRKSGRPVVLAVNKAEGSVADATIAEAYALGLGEPVAISAEHGEGMGELYDALAPFAPQEEVEEEKTSRRARRKKREEAIKEAEFSSDEFSEDIEDEEIDPAAPLQLAIIGRPNAGKSTLVNHLLGEDRVLTGPEAGITRDAIAIPWQWQGHDFTLVDTAGMRRKAKVQKKLEKLSVGDSLRAIRYAQVVILMLDCECPLESQDTALAALVEREGRVLILALNKWDRVKEKDRKAYITAVNKLLETQLPQLRGIPVVPLSAQTGEGIPKLMKTVLKQYQLWNKRLSTGPLNRWLEAALAQHSPPLVAGRRLKIKYVTQAKTRPPTFAFFVTRKEKLPDSYQRYLVNSLREAFDLPGIPIRLILRQGKNPYAEKKK